MLWREAHRNSAAESLHLFLFMYNGGMYFNLLTVKNFFFGKKKLFYIFIDHKPLCSVQERRKRAGKKHPNCTTSLLGVTGKNEDSRINSGMLLYAFGCIHVYSLE